MRNQVRAFGGGRDGASSSLLSLRSSILRCLPSPSAHRDRLPPHIRPGLAPAHPSSPSQPFKEMREENSGTCRFFLGANKVTLTAAGDKRKGGLGRPCAALLRALARPSSFNPMRALPYLSLHHAPMHGASQLLTVALGRSPSDELREDVRRRCSPCPHSSEARARSPPSFFCAYARICSLGEGVCAGRLWPRRSRLRPASPFRLFLSVWTQNQE